MVVSTFFMLDKNDREMIFEESFLLPDIKSNVVLGILFRIISNADVDFNAWELQ